MLHSKHKELIKTASVYCTWLSALPGTKSQISFIFLSLRTSDIINCLKYVLKHLCCEVLLLSGQQTQQWGNSGLGDRTSSPLQDSRIGEWNSSLDCEKQNILDTEVEFSLFIPS